MRDKFGRQPRNVYPPPGTAPLPESQSCRSEFTVPAKCGTTSSWLWGGAVRLAVCAVNLWSRRGQSDRP